MVSTAGIVYIVFFAMTFLVGVIVIGIIAGKDIWMSFKRRLQPNGCDVFIANTNRAISHHYIKPKNNSFKIDDLLYITNPMKTMNFSEETKNKIKIGMAFKENRLNKRITELKERKNGLLKYLQSKDKKVSENAIRQEIERVSSIIEEIERKKENRLENYFKDKRPAFFYIEGDPIPKDFYEYYSTLDSKMVDNLVSQAISQPPNKQAENDLRMMKVGLIIGGAALVIIAFFMFRSFSAIKEICLNLGVACGL